MSPLNAISEVRQVLSEVAVTTSQCTDDSQESAGLLPGSPRILSESKMAALPNTGTSYKDQATKAESKSGLVTRNYCTLFFPPTPF
jgi:hypothetical protein